MDNISYLFFYRRFYSDLLSNKQNKEIFVLQVWGYFLYLHIENVLAAKFLKDLKIFKT